MRATRLAWPKGLVFGNTFWNGLLIKFLKKIKVSSGSANVQVGTTGSERRGGGGPPDLGGVVVRADGSSPIAPRRPTPTHYICILPPFTVVSLAHRRLNMLLLLPPHRSQPRCQWSRRWRSQARWRSIGDQRWLWRSLWCVINFGRVTNPSCLICGFEDCEFGFGFGATGSTMMHQLKLSCCVEAFFLSHADL